jgi:hypothetical protein
VIRDAPQNARSPTTFQQYHKIPLLCIGQGTLLLRETFVVVVVVVVVVVAVFHDALGAKRCTLSQGSVWQEWSLNAVTLVFRFDGYRPPLVVLGPLVVPFVAGALSQCAVRR